MQVISYLCIHAIRCILILTSAGIRLTSCYVSDVDIANALTYKNDMVQIYSNSWGPGDNGILVSGPSPMLQGVLQSAVEQVIIPKC